MCLRHSAVLHSSIILYACFVGLDSYQEADLGVLRERWTEALEKRREYLDSQLQKIMTKDCELLHCFPNISFMFKFYMILFVIFSEVGL